MNKVELLAPAGSYESFLGAINAGADAVYLGGVKYGARAFADARVLLFGNESQTVGPEDAPMEVHLILLGAEAVLLEGIRLADVPEGVYLLNAAPLNLSGAEGAPCRALLIAQI